LTAARASASTVAPPVASAMAACCDTGVELKNASFCVVAVPILVPLVDPSSMFLPSAGRMVAEAPPDGEDYIVQCAVMVEVQAVAGPSRRFPIESSPLTGV
jgi:hypothetical protein